MEIKNLVNFALLIVVNTMWAAQYAAYKTASSQMGPVAVSTWTFLFAAIVLVPFLIYERLKLPADSPYRERKWMSRDVIGFVVLGTLGLIPASAFLAWGTERSTASNAALIYLTIPILTALLAWVMLGERMTIARWVSLGISLLGVLLLSRSDLSNQNLTSSAYLAGNLLVLIACASSSFYNVYCKGLLQRFTALEILVYSYVIAVVVSIPLLIWAEPVSWSTIESYSKSTWVAVLVLSVFSWGLAMVLWMFVLGRLDVSQASVSIYLLPFLGVVIAAITLHERISGSMLLGGGVTLLGALLITLADSPPGTTDDASDLRTEMDA